MPRTRFDKPKYPPIDKLKACLLERKMVMGLEYKDMADAANISSVYMRKLMANKHTDEWPNDIRKAVCRKCGLTVKTVVGVTEWE